MGRKGRKGMGNPGIPFRNSFCGERFVVLCGQLGLNILDFEGYEYFKWQ